MKFGHEWKGSGTTLSLQNLRLNPCNQPPLSDLNEILQVFAVEFQKTSAVFRSETAAVCILQGVRESMAQRRTMLTMKVAPGGVGMAPGWVSNP